MGKEHGGDCTKSVEIKSLKLVRIMHDFLIFKGEDTICIPKRYTDLPEITIAVTWNVSPWPAPTLKLLIELSSAKRDFFHFISHLHTVALQLTGLYSSAMSLT